MDFKRESRKPNPRLGITKKKEKEFDKHEERVSKSIIGHRTKASGAGLDKGDAKSKFLRVECKSTEKDSLSIKKSWLDKINSEARITGKEPVFAFQFNNTSHNWIAVKEEMFHKMLKFCIEEGMEF